MVKGGGLPCASERKLFVNKLDDLACYNSWHRAGLLTASSISTPCSAARNAVARAAVPGEQAPALGKTSLAVNIAYNAASRYATTGGKEGAIVGFFSLEMSADQLAARILAEQSNISGDSIRKGDISEDDFRRFAEASQRLAQVPLYRAYAGLHAHPRGGAGLLRIFKPGKSSARSGHPRRSRRRDGQTAAQRSLRLAR